MFGELGKRKIFIFYLAFVKQRFFSDLIPIDNNRCTIMRNTLEELLTEGPKRNSELRLENL